MKKLCKLSVLCMVALMMFGTHVLAKSMWCTANGGSYTVASTYKKANYDGITINVSKIAKDGETTDCSSYKKVKVKVSGNSNVTWLHSSSNMDSVESKQTAERVCTKGKTYTFVLTDGNGNIGMNSGVTTAYKGNSSLLNAEAYVTEKIY